MGRQDLRSRTPLRAVELCSTPRKFFEKNLTKNFYLSPPKRGTYVPLFLCMGRQDLRSRTPLKVLGFHPKPHKPFEKGLSENFTCLHPTCVEGPALAERKKAACPVRSRTAVRDLSCGVTRRDLRAQALRRTQFPEARTALTECRCSSS